MDRIRLIQAIIQKNGFSGYLEIGTNKGYSFLPLKCRKKYAVDPGFKIPLHFLVKWYLLNPGNLRNRYFRETSDEFFIRHKKMLEKKGKIDVFLIDGLHTYEQSLRDVMNAMMFLSPEGLIVMHDCLPPDEIAATPADSIDHAKEILKDKWQNAWCGDVWKTIVYLREKHADLIDVCVIDTDFGLGIVRLKKTVDKVIEIDQPVFARIKEMDYRSVKNDPSLLNLKPVAFADQLIGNLQRAII